jgi:hypothetical protein
MTREPGLRGVHLANADRPIPTWPDILLAYDYVDQHAPYVIEGDAAELLGRLYWARFAYALSESDRPRQMMLFDAIEGLGESLYGNAGRVQSATISELSLERLDPNRVSAAIDGYRDRELFGEDPEGGRLFQHGTDGLATYIPLHIAYSLARRTRRLIWGILVSKDGIFQLGAHLARVLRLTQPKERVAAIELAFQVLLRHELFHFKVEQWALMLELITGRPFYGPYLEKVYAATFLTDACLEEALANRAVLDSHKVQSIFPDAPVRRLLIETFFERQGPGYRNYTLSRQWNEGPRPWRRAREVVNGLCNQIVCGQTGLPTEEEIPFYLYPPNNNFLRAEDLVPVHIVGEMRVDDVIIPMRLSSRGNAGRPSGRTGEQMQEGHI